MFGFIYDDVLFKVTGQPSDDGTVVYSLKSGLNVPYLSISDNHTISQFIDIVEHQIMPNMRYWAKYGFDSSDCDDDILDEDLDHD